MGRPLLLRSRKVTLPPKIEATTCEVIIPIQEVVVPGQNIDHRLQVKISAAGVYLDNNPHSGFVYLFTALHALHVAGGMAALAGLALAAWRQARPCLRERWTGVTALYWHFMDGLWIYLLVVLFAWK